MKILISGAGVAGTALALQLDPTKFDITLIERAPDFRNYGYSIILWNTGKDILHKIVGDEIHDKLTVMEELEFHAGAPLKKIWSLDTHNLACTMRRQDIMDALSSKVLQNKANINLKFSTEILSIDQDEKQATVTFNDGTKADYDVVILAEGANSFLRDKYFATKQITEPYYARYQWIKSKHKLKHTAVIGFIPGLEYFLQSVGGHTVLGYYTGGDTDAEARVLSSLNEIDWIKKAKIEIDHTTIHDFTLKTVSPHNGFIDRTVLIGDSYHAHAPTIGYGTSLALEDSMLIAQILNTKQVEEPAVFKQEFRAYENERNKRISFVYGLQSVIETLGVAESPRYLNTVRELIPLGPGRALEFWLHKIVSYSLKKPVPILVTDDIEQAPER